MDMILYYVWQILINAIVLKDNVNKPKIIFVNALFLLKNNYCKILVNLKNMIVAVFRKIKNVFNMKKCAPFVYSNTLVFFVLLVVITNFI